MLQLVREPLFGNRIKTAKVEARCGVRTWRFCTAEEGRRIVNMGVKERVWGYKETRKLQDEIEAELPANAEALAKHMLRFEAASGGVAVINVPFMGHPTILLGTGLRPLHEHPVPSISMVLDILHYHHRMGRITTAGGITAIRQAIVHVPDTIPDDLFSRMVIGGDRDIMGEMVLREASTVVM